MFRADTDPDDVRPEQVLCNFCSRPWTVAAPFIEGHQGSHICGSCMTLACEALASGACDTERGPCTMCLEDGRDEPHYRGPNASAARICRRCVELAAKALERDRDYAWKRPE